MMKSLTADVYYVSLRKKKQKTVIKTAVTRKAVPAKIWRTNSLE